MPTSMQQAKLSSQRQCSAVQGCNQGLRRRQKWCKHRRRQRSFRVQARLTDADVDEGELDALTDYICNGVIAKATNLTHEGIRAEISRWREGASIMAQNLGFGDDLDEVQKQRIYQYYLPVFFWTVSQLQKHQERGGKKPVVIGMSAPQGCGKTTIVNELEKLYQESSVRCASVSVDDFYLCNADQKDVSEGNPDNRLVQGRGNAGTHDLQLGADTLKRLQQLGSGEQMAVPRYDKSAYGGEGDTADKENWPVVTGPLDIILFEGWMLGFSPVGKEKAAQVEGAMAQVDEYLKQYEPAWDSNVHAWLVIKVQDAKWVHKWRLEAEQKMKAAGKEGMTDEQVQAFVDRYLPAYDTYLPHLYAKGPTTCQEGRTLFVEVDEHRQLVDAQAK